MDSCKLYLASAYLPYINKNYLLSLDRHDYSNFNDYSKFNCNRHDYSNFNAENVVTEVQETLDNLPISQNNPCETLDSGILMLEQCLNEQAPIKKLSKAKHILSHKPWITPCLLQSIKTKNKLYRALVRSGFSSQKAHAKYKKYRNKVTHLLEMSKRNYYQSQFLSCRNDSGKMWKLINTLTSSKENVRALQRNYLTLSNQTTQAIHKSCPIYSTPTLSQLDSN